MDNISEFFSNLLPYRKKSAVDWIVPSSIGLGVGVLAGIGVGLLVAPRSGEETRQQLKDSAERVREKAMNLASKAKEEASKQIGRSQFANDIGHEVR